MGCQISLNLTVQLSWIENDIGRELFSTLKHRVWFLNHGKYAWSWTLFINFRQYTQSMTTNDLFSYF